MADEGKVAEGDVAVADPPPEEPPEKTVPLSALEDERAKRQAAEDNVGALSEHLRSLQSLAQPQQKQPEDALSLIDDDSVLTGKETKALLGKLEQKFGMEMQRIGNANTANNAVLQVKAEHPDYENVINTNLVNVLDKNPDMRAALASASEQFRPMLAYTIGTMDEAYTKQVHGKVTGDIKDRLKANALKPGSVNMTGSSPDDTDTAKVIASESSEDFEKRIARVKARG